MTGRRREGPAARRERLAAVDDPSVVLDAGLRFLEARPRSIDETRRRLLTAGYQPELVDRAVARLVDLGLLDDEAFGRAWVASRDRAHPRGERALRTELLRKGIGREVVDAILAERSGAMPPETPTDPVRAGGPASAAHASRTAPGSADDEAARRLLARRRATLERVADPRLRRGRAYALLARNGFDPETAAREAARFAEEAEDARE